MKPYYPPMKKAVLAIDSFKGCLTSAEAEAAAAEGVHAALPECEVIRIPVADGGEGMLDVLIAATHGKSISVQAHGPLMELREACYGISGDGRRLSSRWQPSADFHSSPRRSVTRCRQQLSEPGELIRDALQRGCRHFIIGLGGSATNDAGLGMLRALGFRFPDKTGNVSGYGGQMMGKVDSIDTSSVHPLLSGCTFTAACDVRNPFYGTDGAAYVFAPQKGADAAMIEALDAGMRHLAAVIFRTTGKDISSCPGAGAAGGMGGSLVGIPQCRTETGHTAFAGNAEFCRTDKRRRLDYHRRREIGQTNRHGESSVRHTDGSKKTAYSRRVDSGRHRRYGYSYPCRISRDILHHSKSRRFGTSHATGIRAHEYPPYRRADMQDYPLTARQCRVCFFASSSKGLAAIISVTAVNIINTPSMMRGVSCSPNTATPKNRAVTGSNAPKMAAGVEPML